jgi:cell division septation protein DedD
MVKQILLGLGLGLAIIAIALVLYFFFLGGVPHIGSVKPEKPVAASQTPGLQGKPPVAGPTIPAPAEQPKPPLPEPVAPSEATSPKPHLGPAAPLETVLTPLEPEHKYGLVIGSYRKYHEAAKKMTTLKKQGKPAFIDQHHGKYRVWVGPFSTRREARAAAKSLQAKNRISGRLQKLIIPVPK